MPAPVPADPTLGDFSYHEWKPPLFAGLVDRIWCSAGRAALPRKQIFPSTSVELIVSLGEPMQLTDRRGVYRLGAGSLSGLQGGPVILAMGASFDTLGIRLRPAGAYALVAGAMAEISDRTLDLDVLLGRAAAELAERCHDARTPAARLRCADAWLRARLAGPRRLDPAIAWSAAALERSGGALPIAALRAETGYSKARLAAAFRAQIGFSPKRYARIVRLRRAMALLHAGTLSAVEVALEAGYADQAHMVGDFRDLTGLTPGAFTRAPRYAVTLAVATP